MKIKALVSFSGALSMHIGQVTEYSDKAILQDLLKAKYIEEVKDEVKEEVTDEVKDINTDKPKKGEEANGNKQSK